MELDEFEPNAMRTASGAKHREQLLTFVNNDALWNMLHGAIGCVTESAELLDGFKKYIAYGKNLDYVNLDEEIGDLLWYVMLFAVGRAEQVRTVGIFNSDGEKVYDPDPHFTGADMLRRIMSQNIAKLKARYPDKFDDVRANHRDLFEERKVLES